MKLLLTSFLFISQLSFAQDLSDDLDKNSIPAPLEKVDENPLKPSIQKQEEKESDFIQTDDPEKKFDHQDEELDERLDTI